MTPIEEALSVARSIAKSLEILTKQIAETNASLVKIALLKETEIEIKKKNVWF